MPELVQHMYSSSSRDSTDTYTDMPKLEEVIDEDDVSVIQQQRRENPERHNLDEEIEQLVRTESRKPNATPHLSLLESIFGD